MGIRNSIHPCVHLVQLQQRFEPPVPNLVRSGYAHNFLALARRSQSGAAPSLRCLRNEILAFSCRCTDGAWILGQFECHGVLDDAPWGNSLTFNCDFARARLALTPESSGNRPTHGLCADFSGGLMVHLYLHRIRPLYVRQNCLVHNVGSNRANVLRDISRASVRFAPCTEDPGRVPSPFRPREPRDLRRETPRGLRSLRLRGNQTLLQPRAEFPNPVALRPLNLRVVRQEQLRTAPYAPLRAEILPPKEGREQRGDARVRGMPHGD
mmetsp:Transcript_9008/g.11507  ORF Transcript_9008/g.11507 Transcript_9008/m.11507 type:complete len:267 (-) Transcript_9008:415-1215(-)